MKKLLIILSVLLCGIAGLSQSKYNLPYDSVLIRQLNKYSHFYVKGNIYAIDSVTTTSIGDGIFSFSGQANSDDLIASITSAPGGFSVHTGRISINQGADLNIVNDVDNPNAPYLSLASFTPLINNTFVVNQTGLHSSTGFSGLPATTFDIYRDSLVMAKFEDSALLMLKNIPSGDNYSRILAWDFATGKIGKTTGSGLFWPTSGAFSLKGTVTGNNGGHDFTLSGTHETFLISDTTGFSSLADDKTKEKTVILNHSSNAVMAWLNEAETRRNFLLIDSTGAAISLAAGKIFRGGDDDSTSYIGASYVQRDWVLDHIGGGGGGSLLPLTGTGTATGDITGDLNSHDLSLANDAGSGLYINHAGGTVVNYTGYGNFAIQSGGNFFEDQHGTPKGIQYDADYSVNYTHRSLVDSGFVGSIIRADSLLTVTRRGNSTDSIKYNNISAFKRPTSIYKFGDSNTADLANGGVETTDSIYVNRFGAANSLTVVDEAQSSRGIFIAIQNHNSVINPGHSKMATWQSINDPRYGGGAANLRRMYNKVINGLKAMFFNQYLLTWVQAGSTDISLTKSGGTNGYTSNTVGGKGTNGWFTTTSGNYEEYAFTGRTNVGAALIGYDSVTLAGAAFISTLTDVTTSSTVISQLLTTNSQTDGQDGNTRSPMAIIYGGLNPTHYYTLKITSNQSTNVLAIDYFGHIVDPAVGVPMVWFHPSYLTAVGYASAPANASNTIMDGVSSKMDSLETALLSSLGNYPLIGVSNCVDTTTGLRVDGIHWNDAGHRAEYLCMAAALPSLGVTPSNYNLFLSAGHLYVTLGDTATQVDNYPGNGLYTFSSGLTNNLNVITDNLATGVSGQGSLIGSNGTSNGVTYKATTGNGGAGADHIFTGGNNGATEIFRATSSGYVGIGVTPGQTMLDIKSRAATDYGLKIKEAASQSTYPFHIVNSADALLVKVDPSGGLQVLGGINSYAGASVTLQVSGGAGYIDFYDGGSFLTGNIRGNINLQPGGSTVLAATSTGVAVTGLVTVAGTSGNTFKWSATSGTPVNSVTPAGFVRIDLGGAAAWLPYYQ